MTRSMRSWSLLALVIVMSGAAVSVAAAPRPGAAKVFVYPKCQAGRVAADVVPIDKGHTEGLEPRITEELVRLMLSARGGKIQKNAKP